MSKAWCNKANIRVEPFWSKGYVSFTYKGKEYKLYGSTIPNAILEELQRDFGVNPNAIMDI